MVSATRIKIQGGGRVNNSDTLDFQGAGVIRCPGVYDAIINFSSIPKGFHPAAIGTFIVTTCCGYGASTRHGAKNFSDIGAIQYNVERDLMIKDGTEAEIHMIGIAKFNDNALDLDINFVGKKLSLPENLAGHSVYFKIIKPIGDGQLRGRGEGSLFRTDGTDIPVKIRSSYHIEYGESPKPIKEKQYRVATEDGVLNGTSYTLRVHSIFDGVDPFDGIDPFEQD
jgi:hypothetical protein